MTNLLRKVMTVFGSNAGVNQIAKIGSLAAGTPQFSTDPAEVQSYSNYLDGWFGCVLGDNSPAIEDMNALNYLYAYQLAYVLQKGIPEWDADTTYYIGDKVTDGATNPDDYYVSLVDDNIGNALSDPSFWKRTTGSQRDGDFLVTGQCRANSGFYTTSSNLRFNQLTSVQFTRREFGGSGQNDTISTARGNMTTPLAAVADDIVFGQDFLAYSGAFYADAARVRVVLIDNPGGTLAPAKIEHYVSNNATSNSKSFTEFTGGIALGDNATTDSNLGTIDSVLVRDHYEGHFLASFDDGFDTPQFVNIRYVRDGNKVTLSIPSILATTSSAAVPRLATSLSLPTALKPTNDVSVPVWIVNNSVFENGVMRIFQVNGKIEIDRASLVTFTSSQTCGWPTQISITYMLN